ncbi:transmembrane protein 272 [Electrophorus electricus]|uniref:Uncharacterized protein n=1 Tax=Electrophorus electricus TaxID=8005 RepID=A0AAY5F072_ELEEL|nr:transmembrane protein 272 [Electrophorus electricus]
MEDRTLLQNIRSTKLNVPAIIISKIFAIALPITQVVIGVQYLKECPAQPYIPIYLLVSGVFSLTMVMLACMPCTEYPEDGSRSVINSFCTTWNSLVSLFLFCWFITGNVWIYSIYAPNYYNPEDLHYCAKTLYLFAFWTTNLVYILLGMLLVGGCCALLCLCMCNKVTSTIVDEV